ncbi:NAD(P)-dependent oxidoreductase [Ruminococcus sp. CLA-AA-H200]|uniref:NAD(P)-dependent oxidoreductase n=1 Tax=Ruminococcus turbiniformis TaxID=2881258 RepID=A0ABS8FVL8_9FIRM|nr:NAD(P)-dependent oxidoreductase [Ruminococcus turbiniformis]MCC2253393.1 NAD(P)-dependent oxidoreductase [Ruminococcus turbiniformis]
MRILVTGSKGYIGRYAVDLLLKEGHTIIDYDRDQMPPYKNPNRIFVHGECNDATRLLNVYKEYNVEAILHLAGQSSPWVSLDSPIETINSNMVATITVLDTARLAGIKRVVVFSSDAAYGEQGDKVCDAYSAMYPRTVYAVTKVANEMLARVYNINFGMSCVAIRCGRVFGGRRLTKDTLKDMLLAAVHGEKFVMEHGADQLMILVHVDDIADLILRALTVAPEKVSKMAVYNGMSYGAYVKDVVKMVQEFVPDFTYEVGPGREIVNGIENENPGKWDMTDTERDLGYKPKHSFMDELKLYYEFLKEDEANY